MNMPTASALYFKCACFSETLGVMAKRISDPSSAQTTTLESPNFTAGKISLLNGAI